MQRSHTARARLSLHATVMLMFMCMMQAKRGTAHRESMYDLQHQGHRKRSDVVRTVRLQKQHRQLPERPAIARGVGQRAGSRQQCCLAAREGSDARTDVRRARYIP